MVAESNKVSRWKNAESVKKSISGSKGVSSPTLTLLIIKNDTERESPPGATAESKHGPTRRRRHQQVMHTVPSYSPGEPASSNTPGATSCIISVRCSFPSCYPFSCDNFWGKAKQSALALLDERLLIIFQAVLQGHPIEHPKSTKRTNAAAAKAIIYTCECQKQTHDDAG